MNMALISKHALVDEALYRGLSGRTAEARWDANLVQMAASHLRR
jgi:hypothetical protein